MLSVEGLVVRYGPIEAVRGIDFTVNRGEVFALLGANGAGKSSTLAAIAGLVKPFAGRIAYDGKPVSGLPPETLSRAGIGLVPEGRRIFASLTVAENLWLGGAAHGSTAERQQLQTGDGGAFSDPGGARAAEGRTPVGRRTADARHRPRPHGKAEAAATR